MTQKYYSTEMIDFLTRTSQVVNLGAFNDVLEPFQVECLDMTLVTLVMALSVRPVEALPVAEELWGLLQCRDYAAVNEFCLSNNLWWGY